MRLYRDISHYAGVEEGWLIHHWNASLIKRPSGRLKLLSWCQHGCTSGGRGCGVFARAMVSAGPFLLGLASWMTGSCFDRNDTPIKPSLTTLSENKTKGVEKKKPRRQNSNNNKKNQALPTSAVKILSYWHDITEYRVGKKSLQLVLASCSGFSWNYPIYLVSSQIM